MDDGIIACEFAVYPFDLGSRGRFGLSYEDEIRAFKVGYDRAKCRELWIIANRYGLSDGLLQNPLDNWDHCTRDRAGRNRAPNDDQILLLSLRSNRKAKFFQCLDERIPVKAAVRAARRR